MINKYFSLGLSINTKKFIEVRRGWHLPSQYIGTEVNVNYFVHIHEVLIVML